MDHWLLLLILGIVGFSAGIIDTLTGGGGLLTLPVLLATGLPPMVALGTNKIQGVIGEITSSVRFLRHHNFKIEKIYFGLACVIISSSLGAILVQHLQTALLEKTIPFLLLAVLIYIAISPRWLKSKHNILLSERNFYLLIGSAIGFYNGFLGPGTGAFWVFSFVCFLNYSIVKATIYTKPLNAIGNLVSVFWFVLSGNIHYQYFFVMAIGQFAGAYIAANWVITKGHWLIRPVFITTVLIMTIILFKKDYF